MAPLPQVRSIDELNARLLDACEKRKVAVLRGQKESIGERLERDRLAWLPIPDESFETRARKSPRAVPG